MYKNVFCCITYDSDNLIIIYSRNRDLVKSSEYMSINEYYTAVKDNTYLY